MPYRRTLSWALIPICKAGTVYFVQEAQKRPKRSVKLSSLSRGEAEPWQSLPRKNVNKSPPPLSASPLGTAVTREEPLNNLFEALSDVWFLSFRLRTSRC